MKRFLRAGAQAILVMYTLGLLSLGVALAAGEDRACSVTFTTGAAGNTGAPSSGTCNWEQGSTVLMQCDAAVYFSATTTATANDFKVDFAANSDPYIIYLTAASFPGGGATVGKVISVLGVSASGTCKFAKSMRRKPF